MRNLRWLLVLPLILLIAGCVFYRDASSSAHVKRQLKINTDESFNDTYTASIEALLIMRFKIIERDRKSGFVSAEGDIEDTQVYDKPPILNIQVIKRESGSEVRVTSIQYYRRAPSYPPRQPRIALGRSESYSDESGQNKVFESGQNQRFGAGQVKDFGAGERITSKFRDNPKWTNTSCTGALLGIIRTS